ncbi:MAG: transglutaminase-like domain-containing protein [Chitinophagales bacterium]|nr:transglutaminase-like domain-containing protein [Chitinophagales bacterium]
MKSHLKENELSALINLLDDPDEEVYRHVTDRLIALGTAIIPSLEAAWEKTFNPDLHYRLEELIHLIQFETVVKDLKRWVKKRQDNLLEAAIIIARYQYPDLSIAKINAQIEKLSKEIWLEMNYNLTPLEQVNVFNHVLFQLNGFSGNTSNIHDPQNAYLNILLETKKGNPVSLSLLYLILADKIKMPVYGINLPQHFVLSFHKDLMEPDETEQKVKSSLLFYINPFNKGIIFSRDDITMFLKKLNITPKPSHYLPCTNLETILALVNSILHDYELAGVADKVMELTKMKEVLTEV